MENANVDVFHRIHVFMSEDKKFSSQQDFMSEQICLILRRRLTADGVECGKKMATRFRSGTIYSAYSIIGRACCRAGIDTNIQSNFLRNIIMYLGRRPECAKRSDMVARFRHATAIKIAQTQQVSTIESDELKVDCDKKRDTLVEKVKKAMAEDQAFRRIFAVIHIAGKQFKVTSNDIIMINKSKAKCGEKLKLQKILMVGGREFSIIGKPLLSTDQVNIEATVLEKPQGRNVIVFKKKRRKNYKRWKETRPDLTVLRINKIQVNPDAI